MEPEIKRILASYAEIHLEASKLTENPNEQAALLKESLAALAQIHQDEYFETTGLWDLPTFDKTKRNDNEH